MSGETAISILRRLLDPAVGDLSPAAAEAILRIHFPDEDQARIDELATKCNFGELSPDEGREYDAYITAADLLSLWQSKARLSLKRQSTAV